MPEPEITLPGSTSVCSVCGAEIVGYVRSPESAMGHYWICRNNHRTTILRHTEFDRYRQAGPPTPPSQPVEAEPGSAGYTPAMQFAPPAEDYSAPSERRGCVQVVVGGATLICGVALLGVAGYVFLVVRPMMVDGGMLAQVLAWLALAIYGVFSGRACLRSNRRALVWRCLLFFVLVFLLFIIGGGFS